MSPPDEKPALGAVIWFGEAPPQARDSWRHEAKLARVVRDAAAGRVAVLVLDARRPNDYVAAHQLLRALFDDARRPERVLHPSRVVALVADGDVEAAFAFGRYGIGAVLEARALAQGAALDGLVARALGATPEPRSSPLPLSAPPRTARLTGRPPDELPAVTIGYAHAPETLAGLAHYCAVLRAHAHESSVFDDVATLVEVMVREGLTCQTNLATKAGTTHSGQFIGSFDFYRELRRSRYGLIPPHPTGAIAMDVFIAVDEILHEMLHLLFLANELRAGVAPGHCRIGEELSLTWWQAAVHNAVFPEWLTGAAILEINDDFMISAENAEPFEFWRRGAVFEEYASYPWVPFVLSALPARAAYIGERPDLAAVVRTFEARPDAAFLVARAPELRVPAPFEAYPAPQPPLSSRLPVSVSQDRER